MVIRIIDAVNEQAPAGAKKLFVKSYGCQMNVYDGFRMAELLAPLGYTLADSADGADVVLLNTCHIREKADDKLFSDLGRFRRAAKEDAILAVGGCTGQALGAKVMEAAPSVSVVFGPQTYHRLPALIEKVQQGRIARAQGHKNAPIRAVDVDFPELEKFDRLPTPGAYGPTAFVTIQEGCDKFCTYCVVPYTRGAEISRPWQHVVAECEQLAAQGVREVTLLGQNVNAYENDGITLAGLCEKVGEIDGIARIRFTTSHPNNTGDDLIEAFATNPKLMPYFHLPVQAGSNRILQAMNRNHTVESYLATLEKVRAARPDIAISGDFIVGFPGETEEDFAATLAVAHQVQYVGAFSFAYSPRPGTPAAELPGQIDEITKKERLAALNVVLDDSLAAFCKKFDGHTVEVLVEGHGGRAEKFGQPQLRGRSLHNLPVNFTFGDADPLSLMGQLVNVRVTHTTAKALNGVLIQGL
ncbi:MAG: tRNA (N6-isopentenyl adenosine(37)-C2)-methylthiotransferase MiaB [Pseudomonadaceae bacterium]|nr:tRNA (N6-isopentenyl adenosine(37)-C2)-methylthiotransferase MiaB [Pseudomonadaceae bacterium]